MSGFRRTLNIEDFWKQGGSEGVALTTEYCEWKERISRESTSIRMQLCALFVMLGLRYPFSSQREMDELLPKRAQQHSISIATAEDDDDDEHLLEDHGEEPILYFNGCRHRLDCILTEFKEDANRDVFRFPPSLNSYERRIVHMYAQEFGLSSYSNGEGRKRYVTVTKTLEPD